MHFTVDDKCVKSVRGQDYTGYVNMTKSGKPCMDWGQLGIDYAGKQTYVFPEFDAKVCLMVWSPDN